MEALEVIKCNTCKTFDFKKKDTPCIIYIFDIFYTKIKEYIY